MIAVIQKRMCESKILTAFKIRNEVPRPFTRIMEILRWSLLHVLLSSFFSQPKVSDHRPTHCEELRPFPFVARLRTNGKLLPRQIVDPHECTQEICTDGSYSERPVRVALTSDEYMG